MTPQVDTIINELVAFETTIKKLKAEHQEQMQTMMQSMFSKFFIAFPGVKTIHWNQYIPYFNDGDECTFTMDTVMFNTAEYVGDRYNEEEGQFNEENSFSVYKHRNHDNLEQSLYQACIAAANVLENLSDTLQHAFGDHVSVFVTAKEASVEEYEHD